MIAGLAQMLPAAAATAASGASTLPANSPSTTPKSASTTVAGPDATLPSPTSTDTFDSTKATLIGHTESGDIYRNSDGTQTLRAFSGRVNFKDAQGNWQRIDQTLVADSSGYHNTADSFSVRVPKTSATSVVQLSAPGWSIDAGLAGAVAGEPAAVTANLAQFASVLPSTDVSVQALADGVELRLTLRDRGSAGLWDLPVRLGGLSASTTPEGSIAFKDPSGSEVAWMANGTALDAHNATDPGGPAVTPVKVFLVQGGANPIVRWSVDPAWLADPARVYPITIDPELYFGAGRSGGGDDAFVSNYCPTCNYRNWQDSRGVYSDPLGTSGISFNAYLHYDLSSIPRDAIIGNGTWNGMFYFGITSGGPFNMYTVGSSWANWSVTWNNQPAINWNQYILGDPRGSPSFYSRDMGTWVGAWVSNPASNNGIMMNTSGAWYDELFSDTNATTGNLGFQSYIDVTYDAAPVMSNLAPPSGSQVGTLTPTLSATYNNEVGTWGSCQFDLYDASGNPLTQFGSGLVSSGSTCSASVPAGFTNWGLTYQWDVWGHTTYGYGGQKSARYYFTPVSVPSAPQSPHATQNSSTATVTWSPSTWNGGGTIDSYAVNAYYTDGTYAGLQNIVCSTCTSTSFSGLSTSSSYYFGVFAHNSMGYSAAANTNTVPTAPAPPGTPTAAAAYASAVVSWSAPAYDGGRSIASYTVTAYDTGGGSSTQACTGACVTAQTMTYPNLVPGHSYYFTVFATNSVGNGPASPQSSTVTVQPVQTLAPTNVTAVRGDKQATLSWTAPSLSVPGLTTYTVYTYKASDNTRLQTTAAGTATSACGTSQPPCFVVSGLMNGTAVYFTVTSTNAVVTSSESSPSNTVTPAGVPFAPINVSATRGNQSAVVSWSPPPTQPDGTPGNNGDAISSYTVTAYDATTNSAVITVSAASSPITVGGLTNGHPYYFTVLATNSVGSGSQSSASNTVTPAGPPFAPTNVAATGGDSQATVSWTAPGANGDAITGYTVTAFAASNGVAVSTITVSSSPATVTGLHNGTAYYFSVHANNSVGAGAESVPSNTVTPAGAPFPPTGVSATENGTTVTVTWSPADANGSTLKQYTLTATPSDGGPPAIANADPSATSGQFPYLEIGTQYTFTVTATNSVGTSSASNPSNAIVQWGPPAAPTDIAAVTSGSQANVTWSLPVTYGFPPTGYIVTAYSTSTSQVLADTVTDPNATQHTMSDLTQGPYIFTVAATSDAGNGLAGSSGGQFAPKYVALGDSYSSGEGAPAFFQTHDGCDRSPRSYAEDFMSQHQQFQFSFLACSGAVIADVRNTAQHPNDTPNGQLAALPTDANLITLTVGGNDANFSTILFDCLAAPLIGQECQNHYPNETTDIQNLFQPLSDLYSAIHAKAPHAQIYVFTYPKFVSNDVPKCGGTFAMDSSEIQWIRDEVDVMDNTIHQAADSIGTPYIHVIDEADAFSGHEVCSSDPWVNGTRNPLNNLLSSFHPNAAGYQHEANDLTAVANLAPPTVTGVAPTGGVDSRSPCQVSVTINGTNFVPDSTVLFGGIPSANVSYVSATQLTAVAPPGADGTVSVTVQDNDGLNVGTSPPNQAATYTYFADTDAPTTTVTLNQTPNGAGWVRADTTVHLDAADPSCLADVASITYSATGAQPMGPTTVAGAHASFTVSQEGVTTVTYSARDEVGNTEASHQLVIRLDKTPPSNVQVATDRGPDHNGWYNHAFQATWTGTDAVSGIASCTQTTYSGPDGANSTISGTCTDVAGNTSAPIALAFKYDATPPVNVHGSTRGPDSNGWYNHPVLITFSGADATSGIDTCTQTTYGGPDARGVTVTGSCTDMAGNSAGATFGPFNYDATPPSTTMDGGSVQTVSAGTPLTGGATDNLSGVGTTIVTFTGTVTNVAVTRAATCTSGCGTTAARWSVDTSGLIGAYTVTAASVDVAGNQGPASAPVTLVVT